MNALTRTPFGGFLQSSTAVLVAAFLLQLALLALTFPLPGWEQGHGLFHIDHPFHLYQVTLGRALLEHGALVGYDPFFGGGNLGGVTFNVSAKLPVLASLLVSDSVSSETLYLSYAFLCALIAPLSVASVGVLLRWPVMQTLVLALLGTLFWWIGAFRWYHTAGMASFVCACYTSIVYSVWVFRTLGGKAGEFPYARIGAGGVIGGLGLWLHPLFGVLAATLISGLLLAHYRELRLRSILIRGMAIGLLALALNTPWILAMRTGSNMLELEYVHQIDVGFRFLGDAIIGAWGKSMGSPLNPLVVALALAAIFLAGPERRRELIAFLASGIALLLFAAFGAQVHLLAGLQPNRFLAPGFLIIGVAASYAVADGISWLRTGQGQATRTLVLLVALLPAAILGRELVRELSPGAHGHYGKTPPEVTRPPESVAWLVSWITKNTSNEGRILFETSFARKHGGGHAAGYLAVQTKREFIGAPYPFLMPERSFWDRFGFGRPLAELTPAQLAAGLDLYNVGWAIAHSEELAGALAALPHARLLAQQGELRIFGIERPLSYFQTGEARVTGRDFNRLEVTAKAGDELVLRYHWIKGIATTPPSSIEPVSLSPDLPPFIQISNAPAHFLIHLNR